MTRNATTEHEHEHDDEVVDELAEDDDGCARVPVPGELTGASDDCRMTWGVIDCGTVPRKTILPARYRSLYGRVVLCADSSTHPPRTSFRPVSDRSSMFLLSGTVDANPVPDDRKSSFNDRCSVGRR